MKRSLAVLSILALVLSTMTTVSLAETSSAQMSSTETSADETDGGRIEPAVRDALELLLEIETMTVIVTMSQQVDLLSLRGANEATRNELVINELQALAADSQEDIIELLEARMSTGSVTDFTVFWVLNAVSVTATGPVIEELATRGDVATISPDAIPLVVSGGVPEPNVSVVSAPELWALGHTGQGIVVASLDSGVDLNHPDLISKWRGGTNSWFDPYGQHPNSPFDPTGHGTSAMGVMVGGDSGGTAIGVAPDAKWISAKIFDDQGNATATAIHAAFQWILDPDGNPATDDAPDIVNNSWSFGGPGCNLEFQPDIAALRLAGILPIFAAGNFGPAASTSVSPANNPGALAVGGVDNSGVPYAASSNGPSACGEPTTVFPELVAPAVDITSAERFGLFQTTSGTSLAAPHVSGAMALLLGVDPRFTTTEIEAAVIGSAMDLGPTGPDNRFGYGLLNVSAAYELLIPASPVQPGLYFSTLGNSRVPGISGPADNSDIYREFEDSLVRAVDATLDVGLPASEAVDGLVWRSSTEFYVSLSTSWNNAGMLAADEDVLMYRDGTWSVFFDGSAEGIGSADLDAISIDGGSLYFSTNSSTRIPGVPGPFDDADIYRWDGNSFARIFDGSANGVPGSADIDGLAVGADGSLSISFDRAGLNLPILGLVQDEDVVTYSSGSWSLYFDGSAAGLNLGGHDLNALDIHEDVPVGPVVSNVAATPNPTSGQPLVTLSAVAASMDSTIVGGEWFLHPDPGQGGGSPMTVSGSGPWTLTTSVDLSSWDDGSFELNVRAVDSQGRWSPAGVAELVIEPTPEPVPELRFSTVGSVGVPGVGGSFDDSDIYNWNGSSFSRVVDATTDTLMPSVEDVDALSWVSPSDFYVSISDSWNIPGPENGTDEDVLHYLNGVWSIFFDGSAHGLGAADLDAVSIVGDDLYFSTERNRAIPGVSRPFDDADIYRWDGSSYERVFDASAAGFGGADIDGLSVHDHDHFFVSFDAGATAVPGLGTVQDEDVVEFNEGVWTVLFDGTVQGLTDSALDLDAIDVENL